MFSILTRPPVLLQHERCLHIQPRARPTHRISQLVDLLRRDHPGHDCHLLHVDLVAQILADAPQGATRARSEGCREGAQIAHEERDDNDVVTNFYALRQILWIYRSCMGWSSPTGLIHDSGTFLHRCMLSMIVRSSCACVLGCLSRQLEIDLCASTVPRHTPVSHKKAISYTSSMILRTRSNRSPLHIVSSALL